MLLDRILFADKTPGLLKKGLDFQSARQLLVSNNISNMETPGYKAVDVDFAQQLRQAGVGKGGLHMANTDPKHIGAQANAVKHMQPEVIEEPDAAKSNGNNVNVDKEMAKLAETQLMYNTIAQAFSKRGSTLRAAITESAQ